MIPVREVLNAAQKKLHDAGIGSARLDAQLILCHYLKMPRSSLLANQDTSLDKTTVQKIFKTVYRRAKREPLAYIFEQKDFWEHRFIVSPDTLVPRPDSETLIEAVLNIVKSLQITPKKFFDLGTGSGCLLLSLLYEFQNSFGVALDISYRACKIAQKNALNLSLHKRTIIINADWCSALNCLEKNDVVICNPPYIDKANPDLLSPELMYEPETALYAKQNGLQAYKLLASQLSYIVAHQGLVFFEIGFGQKEDVTTLFTNQGFLLLKSFNDLQNIPRCLCFQKSNL